MPRSRWLGLAAVAFAWIAAACTGGPAGGRGVEDHLRANLAKLGDEDRKLAEAQRWCPVADDTRLGETGVPFKVMVNGEPVFLCCKGCAREAQKNPARILAKVQEVKMKAVANPGG